MAVRADILPPRYRDAEHVARGGMGDVYRATDTVLGRTVAIKVLGDRYADHEGVRQRFTREALTAARLSDVAGAVTIFDVGEWEGRPYIVMEYFEGGSLEDRIRAQGAQDPADALRWLSDAAGALDAAHAAGVVHRDVKPGNLLLDGRGEVHVADFGIASAVGLDSMTMTGTVLGTAGYLSPEQAQGERATPASDRYGLGVVAFELLTGERPFASDTPTAEAAQHVNAPVPSLSERADMPRELDPVIQRALAKDPAARYPSCADLVAALREALAVAAGTTHRLAAVEEERFATAPIPAAARRPNLLVWGGLLLLALLALGGGLALASVLGGSDEPEVRTVRETRVTTEQGRITTQTVTTTTAPTTAPTTTAPTTTAPTTTAPTTGTTAPEEPVSPGEAARLNDQAFGLMNAGRYAEALPLLERAIVPLRGSGSLTEAYTSYNLAKTRLELGRCDDVIALLDRSQSLQRQRSEIARARAQAAEQCA